MNMFLTTAISNEVRQAIQNNQQFTRVAYSWSVTLAKSNALDQGIASLGQTRPCINNLQALVDLKSDPALKQPGASIPLDNEVDYLAAKEWCYRQEVRKAHAKLGQANGTDDIPQTQRDQKKLANELSLAAMNEVEMVDLEYHGKENKKKLNYIVQRKRELSALDVALFGWEASLALRDGHLGLTRGSSATTRLDIEAYQTHKERSDILTKLFHVSKASVMNTYSLPHLARFACNPKAELQNVPEVADLTPDDQSGTNAEGNADAGQGKKRLRNDDDSSNDDDEDVQHQSRASKKARLQQADISQPQDFELPTILQEADFAQQGQLDSLYIDPAMLEMPQEEQFNDRTIEPATETPVPSVSNVGQNATQEHRVNRNPSEEELIWFRDNVLLGRQPFRPRGDGSAASGSQRKDR
ncbi:hypothetical protein GE21DRAFT_5282 [Neurospora crassa]|uniref:Uncharacterized protein n=2 Tax=Neurospora crassa TaxID=5141 RepID=Q7SAU5_NEUCR|nr:hypothetical protein NCU07645 [Neurospora crassa OR74A]EAA33517.1 hypothetical protein NCU07645 [Neurospora crassa OR74A]KHE78669.1 hypothetical protein GE21DRAFT_5282 [Neurospora crassa]CAE85475.1 hypothetical protein [Neurospora crassa]|eukprot:XP_962753.1 hypothetical protein NCU07645 [Neurospora crassa OR74A]